MTTNYGTVTEAKIAEVVEACKRHSAKSIVALAGAPGTGKSFIASIAAQRFTGEPALVREVQFHQSFTYEEFIEGLRFDSSGAVAIVPGIFSELNQIALDDPEHQYVLLIEELTRANLAAVLGELMTYLEYRDRPFITVYSRRPTFIAKNLGILATYNPSDRSAIEMDTALIRRLRIIGFPPDVGQLEDMLAAKNLPNGVLEQLKKLFEECRRRYPDDFETLMPFGHGIFADITQEKPDLYELWVERIAHLLRRPLMEPNMFCDVIEANYPWRDQAYQVPQPTA